MMLWREPVRHPEMYLWYILLASLDVLLTWIVLRHGGFEANAIAAWVIDQAGMPGAAFFKFATVMLVLVTCEVIARRDEPASRFVAGSAVLVNAVPVVISVGLIAQLVAFGVPVRI